MTKDHRGQVITFYSFKGGTGRTMALANVAWILAAAGNRVLVADWDLESPGLHRFFHPFMDANVFENQGGVINLIREYEDQSSQDVARRPANWHEELAQVRRYAFPLNWQFQGGGEIHFLSAGRQNQDYRVSVGGLDLESFFEVRHGEAFFKVLRSDMKRNYDYTLIDSRTGLSDFADICTIHLPDTLVDCFTLSEQGIDGAAQVARRVESIYKWRNIRVLPVPMRVDPAEKEKADAGRAIAMQRFSMLPAGMSEAQRQEYWAAVEVPYRAFYAYEETLATFGDPPGAPTSLLSAYERLTGYITSGEVRSFPPMDEPTRKRGKSRFERRFIAVEDEISLRYAPHDQIWAEWIEQVLVAVDVRVNDPWRHRDRPGNVSARTMTLLSHANESAEAAMHPRNDPGARPPLAVYLADLRQLPGYPPATSAYVFGQPERETVERILRLVGRSGEALVDEVLPRIGRFPGEAPEIFNVPTRNLRFTGREDTLRLLRQRLHAGGSTVVLPGVQPVALHGMGGIGKSQLAVEYAYRFQSAYDVVWWITSDPPQFIDVALGDLGTKLRLPGQANVFETTRAVLHALSKGEPYDRWLIIFDNADEIERAQQFLPSGPGHVLITSRNLQWRDNANTIPIEVFARSESIAHLRSRLPGISTDDANRVAEALGDLPIAISAAGAWLADTGTPVDDYLQQIAQHGPGVLPEESGESTQPVQKTWDLSLDRLQSRSKGAYRLLQLCSVLAPEIALDLVHSEEMGGALRLVDTDTSERMERGKLVQHINRLALLKLDTQSGHGGHLHVHRLLQHVVRDRMTADELGRTRHAAHLVLAASRPRGDVDSPETWRRFRMLWPHLEVSDAVNCTHEAVRELLIDRVRYLWHRGNYGQGEELARRIESAWTNLLQTLEDPKEQHVLQRQLLSLRFNLGNMLRDAGRFQEARDLDEAVLEEQVALLGPASPYTLMTSGGLSGDLRTLGLYKEALELDRRTYAAWATDYGGDYPRTLNAHNNLAASFRLVGDFRAARQHDEEVYKRRRVVLEPKHPYTLHSASSLGRDLREAGDYEPSAKLLRSVLEDYCTTLGEDSRGALNARTNLAVSVRSAGRAEEAKELLDFAYERLLDTFGATNPDTLACRFSRAANLLGVGDAEQAKTEMEEVERAYRMRLPPLHPHTIACLHNLAAVERAVGDRLEARKLAERAVDSFGKALWVDHTYTLAARMNLAVFTAETGKATEAVEPLRELADRLADILGPEHPDTLRCQANLALLLGNLGRPDGNIDEGKILDRLASRIGKLHPDVITLEKRGYLHRIVDPHPF